MPDAQKKAILRRLSGESVFGYLPPTGFVQENACQFLDLEGRANSLSLPDLKLIFFVRDFNRSDLHNPERLSRLTFLGRPRGEGLWVRIALHPAGEVLEGLASTDLSLLNTLLTDQGLHLTPPDTRSNTLRIFVPHQAMATLEVLGVIGTRKPLAPIRVPDPSLPGQDSLFPAEPALPSPHPAHRGSRS